MTLLHRYWFTFSVRPYHSLRMGCGVTAYDLDDALNVLERVVFAKEGELEIEKVIEDVDISTLDKGHVIPNMEVPLWRGGWFPKGYYFPVD